MEDKASKDTLPVHLILGASDYARIKTETTPRVGAIGEPLGEKTKLGWTQPSSTSQQGGRKYWTVGEPCEKVTQPRNN